MTSSLHLVRASIAAALLAACARPLPVVTPVAVLLSPPEPVLVAAPSAPARVLRILRPKGEDPSPIFTVQADAAHVYFNDGAGRLWSAPKDGGGPTIALVDDPNDSVRSFVIDGESIYYAARLGIRSVPIAGGPSVRQVDNHSGPILLVSDGQHLYHTVFDGSATFRLSLATRREERFCSGGKHQTLAVDEANLYIASYFGGTITAISKKTRRARVLVSGVRRPVRLVVDDAYVYFTSEADGTVRRVAKKGGRTDVLARGQHGQEHLALDGTHVYWATRLPSGGHALMRALRTPDVAATPEQLYGGLSSAAGIAVDDGFVFVADRGAGEVVRVMKDPE